MYLTPYIGYSMPSYLFLPSGSNWLERRIERDLLAICQQVPDCSLRQDVILKLQTVMDDARAGTDTTNVYKCRGELNRLASDLRAKNNVAAHMMYEILRTGFFARKEKTT